MNQSPEVKIELDGSAVWFEVAGATVKLPAAELTRMWIERLQRGAAAPAEFSAQTRGLPTIGAQWDGCTYAGLTVHNNTPMALLLLDGEAKSINWARAGEWAKEQGGVLPSRVDSLILFQNLKAEFDKESWYWTDTVHPVYADSAFIQDFGSGSQGYGRKGYDYRARAVRRVAI